MNGATVRIRIESEGGVWRTSFFDEHNNVVESDVSSLSAAEFAAFRFKAAVRFQTARDALSTGLDCSLADAGRAINVLHEFGRAFLLHLLPNKAALIVRFFETAFAKARRARFDAPDAPLVQLDTPGCYVPFGILPLLGCLPPGKILSKADLVAKCQSFLGFSSIITHGTSNERSTNLTLAASPRLHVKFFYNAGLQGARRELETLRRHGKHISIDGPWPGARKRGARNKAEEQLANILFFISKGLKGRPCNPASQVHHFSCHCDRNADQEHLFGLQGPDGETMQILVEPLSAAAFTLKTMHPDLAQTQAMPLAFLNACGTGVSLATDYTNFVSFFASTNHRAVVATEATVPDDYAAALSGQFYAGLIEGLSSGQALHRAKCRLLGTRQNPLGLLYTYYGEPDLKLSRS